MTQFHASLASLAIGQMASHNLPASKPPRTALCSAEWAAGPLAPRGEKSIVLDQVLSEYRERTAAGEEVRKCEFCERFPQYQSAILRQLEAEDFFLDCCPRFAADDEPLKWPQAGETFLGYEIVEQIGLGGVAAVYLAREQAIGRRHVVIKVSPFGTGEPHRLGRLSHPSIMPILSVQRDAAGWMVICMPLVGLATATDLIDGAFHREHPAFDGRIVARVAREAGPKTKLPPPANPAADEVWRVPWGEAVARLGLQLAEALSAAHAAGILHCDIKPSNILLDWSARPLLLDFNLATDDGAEIGGTLAYMAPERLERLLTGEPAQAQFQPNCDLYSLGAVLHQLLSGKAPVEVGERTKRAKDEDLRALVTLKRQGPAPLVGAGSAVDARLEAIVFKCLAKNPPKRYQSASDLAADLRAYLARGARLVRAVRRNRRSVLLSAAAFGLSVGGLGAYVGNSPSQLDRLYRQGLDDYAQGKFVAAENEFSRCLEIRPGWQRALFGRAQALRRQAKWQRARADFLSLQRTDESWARALAGYCALETKNYPEAAADFLVAYQSGLRDLGFLLNAGRCDYYRLTYAFGVRSYSRVLEMDPEHKTALRNRALMSAALVRETRTPLHPQAFHDILQYVAQDDSFVGSFAAARVYHEAAQVEPQYCAQAVGHFERALQKGAPLEWVQRYLSTAKPLLLMADWDVVERAVRDPSYDYDFAPMNEPPLTADWEEFCRLQGVARPSAPPAAGKI